MESLFKWFKIAVFNKYAVFSGSARPKEFWMFCFIKFIILPTLFSLAIIILIIFIIFCNEY